MRRLSILLVLISALVGSLRAQTVPDSLTVGFVTCYPGPEIFELYGHEAVHVSGYLDGQPIDMIFNYGLFDFDAPNFVGRFVKGETDYMTGVMPTSVFLYPYAERGSKVVERILPLTRDEALQMYRALANDALPENSTYRYKYFSANCATKPIDHLNRITHNRFREFWEITDITYRQLLNEYNSGYPWYQLGIDLVLGSKLDEPVSYAEASFIPMEMDKHYFGELPEEVLISGQGDGNQRGAPTPWFLTPMFVFWLLFAAGLLLTAKTLYCRYISTDRTPGTRKSRDLNIRLATCCWTLVQGLAGLLVWYLTLFSENEGTSPNWNMVWLNPLWLLIAVTIWWAKCTKFTRILCIADAAVTALLLCVWPLLPQCMNPAMIPMMLTTILVSLLPIINRTPK